MAIEIGVSSGTFHLKEKTEDLFPIFEDLGFGICELFLTTFFEYKPDFIKMLQERLSKTSLKVYSIHSLTMQFEPELFSASDRIREDAESTFFQLADACKVLGADSYIFHGPARLKRLPYVMNYPYIAKRLTHLQTELSKRTNGKTALLYENVHWAYFNTPAFFEELKVLSPVGACLDIKQAKQAGISPFAFLDAMGDRVKNVHVCDFDDAGNLAIPGRGTFDFVALFQKLIKMGYNGPVMMELYAKNYQSYSEIKQSYQYLKQCLHEAQQKENQ